MLIYPQKYTEFLKCQVFIQNLFINFTLIKKVKLIFYSKKNILFTK